MIICHAPSRANDGESYLQGEVFMQAEFTFIEKEISYNRKCYVGGKFMQAGIFLIEILDVEMLYRRKVYTGIQGILCRRKILQSEIFIQVLNSMVDFFLYSRELCISGFFYKGGIFNQVEILTLGRSDIRSHNYFPGAADTLLYEGNGE